MQTFGVKGLGMGEELRVLTSPYNSQHRGDLQQIWEGHNHDDYSFVPQILDRP